MSGNTLTDIQIFNAALLRLGETKGVTAVDGADTSKYGTIAGSEYFRTRDEELRSHVWKFAVRRAPLLQSFVAAVATWSGITTAMTVAGVTTIVFTANLTLNAASDLISRTLTNLSVTPLPSWVGQSVSGTGIPAGTVIRSVDYIAKTATLSKQITIAGTAISLTLSPIQVGWLVNSGYVPGNVIPAPPAGVVAGTFIIAVAGNNLTLSTPTTAGGTSIPVAFQPQNAVGYWYMYNEPADLLRDTDVYVILPDFVYIWPFKTIHSSSFPSKHEGNYIYTDLDPGNGNPYVAYIAQVTDPSLFDSLFTDALVARLASKIALYVSGGVALTSQFLGEYQGLVSRAQTYNLAEMDMEPDGDPWWTDRQGP